MKNYIVVLLALFFFGCTGYESSTSEELISNQDEKVNIYHGKEYVDKYDWLRDPDYPKLNNPMVLKFIEDENKESESFFEANSSLLNDVFTEIRSRIPISNRTPYSDQNYIYSSKKDDGDKYYRHYYQNIKTGVTKLILNENKRAENSDYYNLLGYKISPDGNNVIWIEDAIGHEDGILYIKNLSTNLISLITIANVSDTFAWHTNSKSFFYIKKDEKGRDFKIINQSIFDPSLNHDVYTDADVKFQVSLKYSVNKDKLFVYSHNWSTTETHEVSYSADGNYDTEILMSRDLNTYHEIDYIDGSYYAYTNYFSTNFDLVKLSNRSAKPANWEKLVIKHTGTFFKSILFFNDYFAIAERENGMDKVLIVNRINGEQHHIDFDDPIVGIRFSSRQDNQSDLLRLSVNSNLTPQVLYNYNVKEKALVVLNDVTIKGYDKGNYNQERLLVTSNDGTKVPVTIIYNRKFGPNTNNPLFMYVYGSYGDGIPPEFPLVALSAIDRGFTYAIAHVRGGDELGKQWHEQGKLLNRKNTFDDFISISQHLVDIGYVDKGNISVTGESAAGTTIGVAINKRPDLFKSVSILVPFVDVLNTLMDASLSYTMTDWSEYGNPVASKQVFDYMKSYSPYDNIQQHNYPNIYVTGGLDDPAVGYWEPAKWVAKIRDNQTNKPLSLLSFRGGGHMDSGANSVELDFAKQITFLIVTHRQTSH